MDVSENKASSGKMNVGISCGRGMEKEIYPQATWLLLLIELTSFESSALKLIGAFFWGESLKLKQVMGEAVLDV